MTYYNEFDPKAAAWLRELIRAGLIPPGDVDTRSITEIKPHEFTHYTQCHFFAGIGGWPLALALAGWDPARPVWTGSCPCQPFSAAGKQLGTADERHLWPVFANLIRECRPPVVFGEQVASKAGRGWLAGVFADLEGMAYRRASADLCAAGVGAPHIRQRLFWVADTELSERRPINEHRKDEQHRRDGGRQEAHRQLGTRGEVCGSGMADTPSGGQRVDGSAPGSSGHPDKRGADRGLVDSSQSRLEAHPRHGDNRDEPGRIGADAAGPTAERGGPVSGKTGGTSGITSWSRFALIPCADGKARRIEPGLAPMAHGIPARVVRLRGYGNAIVPQVAADFISAYLETLSHAKE